MDLQAAELDRTVDFLASLDKPDWEAQTDCPAWDVRRMYLHVLGACEAGARVRESVRQLVKGLLQRRRQGGALEEALSDIQVREREALGPAEVVEQLRAVAPKAVRGRRRVPALVRNTVKIPIDAPVR